MSSGFQLSGLPGSALSGDDGVHVLQCEHTELSSQFESPAEPPTEITETHDTSPLTFNSLTLAELSEELERCTKETERLQEEVENATKCALENLGCTRGVSGAPRRVQHSHGLHADGSSESTVASAHQQVVTQPLVCGQDSSDVLGKTCRQNEHETFRFGKAVMNLQTKLQKVQMEKDVLSELRMKDSREHVDQMEKMLCMLEDLQNIKRSGDRKLEETENEASALNRKVETLEKNIMELYQTLSSQKKQCGHNSVTIPKDPTPRALSPAADLTDDHINETDELQERLVFSNVHLQSKDSNRGNLHKERVEQLIASLGQEVAMLTDKLSSSKDSGVSLSDKLEMLRKLAERQSSLHQHQVCCLEQQLAQARSQLADARRQKEHSLQQAEELRSRLGRVKRCSERTQCELRAELETLRGQLEGAREQLQRAAEEKSCSQALLEQRAQETRKSQEEELQHMKQEAKQRLARFEDAQSQCQTLHAEREALRLRLDDKEKMVEFLRFQVETSNQMVTQHKRTIDSLQQESCLLSEQLNQQKAEIQQLRAELDRHKSDLAAAEHGRRQLHASVVARNRRAQEASRQKRQLTTQLEAQRVQLLSLTKEHKELQRLHSCMNKEHEGVVLRLQSQLKSAQARPDQVTGTLRTSDGNVAKGMQKEITARREQAASLRVKIQHLEETTEKLRQEKCCQNLKNKRQLQDLVFVREEKRQLADELEALRSKDKQLRERISELEAILHKMSEGFADCQDFIQLQEQSFFRLKLQHALDLKELKGQNVHTALTLTPPVLDSPTRSALTDPPSSQHASCTRTKKQPESPTRDLRSMVKELGGVIPENPRPNTDSNAAGGSIYRRRSAPERVHTATLSPEKAEAAKLRRKTCGSELHFLKTAELKAILMSSGFGESHMTSSPDTAARHTSSPQLLSLGRMSPVHRLLTSDPNS